MRLPPKDDLSTDGGSLLLTTVIKTLREHDVAVEELKTGTFRLMCSSELLVLNLSEYVGRMIIQQLAAKFEIELTAFYYDPLTRKLREPKH